MTSSLFDSSKVVPCESTPLDRVSSGGGPVPQAKKKPSRSFVHVIVTVLLVCLAVTMYSRLSSSASSSSVVDQSVSKSVNKVIENDSIVVPIASLAASETKTSLRQVARGKWTIDKDVHCGEGSYRPLEDGTVYGWKPGSEGYTVAYCETKCEKSPSCTAFVWRHSDLGCFWKHSTSEKTSYTLAGHDCYSYDKDDEHDEVVTSCTVIPSQATLKFPDGIYDKSMNNDPQKLSEITNNCNEYLYQNKMKSCDPMYTASILGCHIYNPSIEPIILGTLKTGDDVVLMTTDFHDAKLSSSKVSGLFLPHAFAAMIAHGCFSWNIQDAYGYKGETYYHDKESYTSTFSKQAGVSVDSSASYFGVTVSAGYKQSNSNSGSSDGSTETAYGQIRHSRNVGTLKNTCFDTSNQQRFDYAIKDLIKPEWIQCWNAIRAHGPGATINQLLTSKVGYRDCFSEIANGGLVMPLSYVYRVGTKSTFHSTYTAGNKTEASGASKAIHAGVSAAGGGAKGSVDTNITKAIKDSKSKSHYSSDVLHHTDFFGSNIVTTCEKRGNCDPTIQRAVQSIHENYALLNLPSFLGPEFRTLDQILQLYYGDYGLPEAFLSAYNTYEYNKQGTVCWGYGFDIDAFERSGYKYPMAIHQRCWTTNKNIVPTGIHTSDSASAVVVNGYGIYEHMGASFSSPGECGYECESTYSCDELCQQELRNYSNLIREYSQLFLPLGADGYHRQGTACWAYDDNQRHCWTTNGNIVPSGYARPSMLLPHPKSCCNQCESTEKGTSENSSVSARAFGQWAFACRA